METLNLFGFISRLIKVNNNNVVKVAKMDTPVNNDANALIKEFLQLHDTKKSGVLPVTRQLALEQIRFLN